MASVSPREAARSSSGTPGKKTSRKHAIADGSGTLSHAAEEVTQLGGHGIAEYCDHSDDTQVAAVFQRIQGEQGCLDLLVNNAFDTPVEGLPENVPFWELPVALWDRLQTMGLRSHYVASVFAARQMVAQRRGLIVNISSFGAQVPLFTVAYGVGKAGVEKLAADTAAELRPHGVAVVSLWPPFIATEHVLSQAERWDPDELRAAVSPRFTGRAVAALAGDPHILEKSGHRLVATALDEDYGFTDVDGAQPPVPAYARQEGS